MKIINQGEYVKTGQRNNGAAVYRNTNSDARVLYRNGDGTWAASNQVADGKYGVYLSVDSANCPASIQSWMDGYKEGEWRKVRGHVNIKVKCGGESHKPGLSLGQFYIQDSKSIYSIVFQKHFIGHLIS